MMEISPSGRWPNRIIWDRLAVDRKSVDIGQPGYGNSLGGGNYIDGGGFGKCHCLALKQRRTRLLTTNLLEQNKKRKMGEFTPNNSCLLFQEVTCRSKRPLKPRLAVVFSTSTSEGWTHPISVGCRSLLC